MKIRWWHIGLLIALAVVLLSPLASSSPDGLEKVGEDKGFIDTAKAPPYQLIGDYLFPGIHNEALATILAGIIGTIATFLVIWVLAKVLGKIRQREAN